MTPGQPDRRKPSPGCCRRKTAGGRTYRLDPPVASGGLLGVDCPPEAWQKRVSDHSPSTSFISYGRKHSLRGSKQLPAHTSRARSNTAPTHADHRLNSRQSNARHSGAEGEAVKKTERCGHSSLTRRSEAAR